MPYIITKFYSKVCRHQIWVFHFSSFSLQYLLKQKVDKGKCGREVLILLLFFVFMRKKKENIIESKDVMLISLRLPFKNNKFKCKIALLQTKKLQNEMIKGPSDYQQQG